METSTACDIDAALGTGDGGVVVPAG